MTDISGRRRVGFLLILMAAMFAKPAVSPGQENKKVETAAATETAAITESAGSSLELRMFYIQLDNPFINEKKSKLDTVRAFWDKDTWDSRLKEWAKYGYNAVMYYSEPWQETQWQDMLIRNKDYPEASCNSP